MLMGKSLNLIHAFASANDSSSQDGEDEEEVQVKMDADMTKDFLDKSINLS